MFGKKQPQKDEKKAVKKDEKALSGNRYGCDECSLRFGTAEMVGIHKLVAHG